jgi:hypothetical protein
MPRRHRNARKDASIASVENTVAKLLGLPRKSVQLVMPTGRHARRDATVKGLRRAWKG